MLRTFDGHISASARRRVTGSSWARGTPAHSAPSATSWWSWPEPPLLLAPRLDVADFVAGTYTFDEVRGEDVGVEHGETWRIRSASVEIEATAGARLAAAHAMRLVPGPLRRSAAWARAIDPIARRVMPGVRTHGSAGHGRTEWYAARDVRRLVTAKIVWEGDDLGALAPVAPPVRFGFASAAAVPTVTTLSSHVADD